jgi:hypothetical protein
MPALSEFAVAEDGTVGEEFEEDNGTYRKLVRLRTFKNKLNWIPEKYIRVCRVKFAANDKGIHFLGFPSEVFSAAAAAEEREE